MIIGDNIRDLREQRNYTQKELAQLLNISPGSLSKYEKGQIQVPIDVLISIADIFNVTVDYIIGRNTFKFDYKELRREICKSIQCFDFINDVLSLDMHDRKLICEFLALLKCRKGVEEIKSKK